MKTIDKAKSEPQPLDLTVKAAGPQGQSFVTPGMMYNKA